MTTLSLNRILYVEDDPDIQKIVGLTLEKIGKFDVKICSSGNQALKEAQEFNPDLFLLDVMMPEMDGPTTLKELRKINQFASTPVIFMTAKAQVHEIEKYKELSITGIIVKPFNTKSLSSQIKDIWEKSHV